MSWREFWNGDHAIYVNEKHKQVHNRIIFEDMKALIQSGDHVLDFGCGEALKAGELAKHCYLVLCDGAPTVVDKLKHDFQALLPEELSDLPDRSFDKIFVVSVIQYLSLDELHTRLADFKRLLAPEGSLYIADIIPKKVGLIADVASLLTMASRYGFFLAGVKGLIVTALSGYSKLRATYGFAKYEEDEIISLLNTAGFNAKREVHNIGPHQHRFTVRVTR